MPASSILRTSPWGNDDQALVDDLAVNGISVDEVNRNARHLIVIAYGSHGQPLVGIVPRGPGEHDAVFARLITRNA